MKWFASIVLALSMSGGLAFAGGGLSFDNAITGIASSDPATAQESIDMLRVAGPVGLEVLLAKYDASPDAKLLPAIDQVAAQHGAIWSRLYWYTDFDQAKAAAKEQMKPILYLRMLGKLTDEYSCANSRFFRTILYSNNTVSKYLREQFILVWESERPVPVITVDYGDGHVLRRTITGNSIQYILDSDGNVIDALPGVYGPEMFKAIVAMAANQVIVRARQSSDREPMRYLARTTDMLLREWQMDLTGAAPKVLEALDAKDKPDATVAMGRTMSKALVEIPLLRQIAPLFATQLEHSVDSVDDAQWKQIAAKYRNACLLDKSSIDLIRSQNPTAYKDDAALSRTVENFQDAIALDTVHNNFQLRMQILNWLAASDKPITLDDLNTRVYAELFRTPRSDPWLGLAPEDTYTALTNDGCSVPTVVSAR